MNLLRYLWSRLRVAPNGCWIWTRSTTHAGYGQFRCDGTMKYSHRAMYEVLRGAIPAHLELDHICRNRRCCNPDHLEPVSHRENILRGCSPIALFAKAEHCIYGHAFTPENTIHVQGGRRCRECKKQRDRRYWERKYGTRGNAQARKTHCPQGHPYNELNTYLHKRRRHCRECMKARSAAQKPQIKEQP
jgi:hypothetical protein